MQKGLDGLAPDNPLGVEETGLNVFWSQPREAGKDLLGTVACAKHPEHMLDGKSPPTNDGLAGKDGRIKGDKSEKSRFVRQCPIP